MRRRVLKSCKKKLFLLFIHENGKKVIRHLIIFIIIISNEHYSKPAYKGRAIPPSKIWRVDNHLIIFKPSWQGLYVCIYRYLISLSVFKG